MNDGQGPKLVIKEKEYFLHALPPLSTPPSAWRDLTLPVSSLEKARTFADGVMLLHTTIATGEMKVLAAGHTTLCSVGERNCPRPDVYRGRIAGLAVDRERLYVLRWNSSPSGASYELLVFRPDNGSLIHTLELKGNDAPTTEPKETTDKGPLRPYPDGVACFATRFKFKGTELLEQSAEKRP
jgi:hypothetical protein